MAIEYLGLSEINGPLVVLEGVKKCILRGDRGIPHGGRHSEDRPYRGNL